jgi:FlaA1/EpsC-like NDP-sugar epimerase
MSPNKRKTQAVSLLLIGDSIAIILAFSATFHLRFLTGVIPVTHGVPAFELYAQVLLVALPLFLWVFKSYGLYDTRRSIRRIEEIFTVIKAASFAILLLTALTFFYRRLTYSRIYLLLVWGSTVFFVSSVRYFLIQWEYKRKTQKKDVAKVLLIGADHNARSIIQWAKNNPHYGQEIIGVLA